MKPLPLPSRALAAAVAACALLVGFAFTGTAAGADAPRYDVPHGFTRCSHAVAWHGFFKWASEQDTNCRETARFMRRYAEHATGPSMPRHVDSYRCRIHYWRDEGGDIYASRHVCTHGRKTIRFYGMV